jgi:hypothetical protein
MFNASPRMASLPVKLEQTNHKPTVNRPLGFGFAVSILVHGLLFIVLYDRIAAPPSAPLTTNPGLSLQLRMRAPRTDAAPSEPLVREIVPSTESQTPPSQKTPKASGSKATPSTPASDQPAPGGAVAPKPSLRRPLTINPEDLQAATPNKHEMPSRGNVFDPAMRARLESTRRVRTSAQPTPFEERNNRAVAGGDVYMSFDDDCFLAGQSFASGRREMSWYRVGCTGTRPESDEMLERVNQRVRARRE